MQGRVGEVAAEVLTDFPDRFADRRRLFVLDPSGSRRELLVENFWPHKERLVLKFAGIDSISDAETLIGAEIQIPQEERAELDRGAVYVSDLVGCRVWVSVASAVESELRDIGAITDVISVGEAPILEIHEGSKEYLVPFAQEYIRAIDTNAKRIELRLPEGMLELDAPLSSEEKEAQKNGGS